MTASLVGAAGGPWAFQAHPEVWVLVIGVVGSYIYAARRIGPVAVGAGEVAVSRRQWTYFVCGALILWLASDWPLHDLAEEYLYAAHMLQHMMLSYFMPPLMLMATPEWLARLLTGDGRAYRVVRWLSHPVVAGVAFNGTIMITHIPGVVNESAGNPLIHYSLHVLLVTTALMMWMAICGPIPEFRVGPGGQMIVLFCSSIVPTVPAGWLTFAEGTVYHHYTNAVRVFGLSVESDQQMAGAIMKIGGSIFLWTLVLTIYIRKMASRFYDEARVPRPKIVGEQVLRDQARAQLTYDDVQAAFERSQPAPEPAP